MSDRKIIEAVQKLAGTQLADEVYLVACSVESVDIPSRTCDCVAIDGSGVTDIPVVQLMADVDDGMLLVPTVGSTVVVVVSKRNDPFVVMFSQLDQVLFISGSSSVTIKDGIIQFNDGSFGGLIKIADLVEKINTIENDLNTLKQVFSTWTPVADDGGAALKAASASWAADEITETQQSDIENTNTTHGQ